MFGQKSSGVDPRPQSAVSSGVGLAGLIGLGCWILIARQYGMDGPYSALAACAACALPMIIWSLLNDKVHLRPTTGIDWQNPKPLKETLDVSIVKLTGLWATWGLIADHLLYRALVLDRPISVFNGDDGNGCALAGRHIHPLCAVAGPLSWSSRAREPGISVNS